jgi:hypothetical protein
MVIINVGPAGVMTGGVSVFTVELSDSVVSAFFSLLELQELTNSVLAATSTVAKNLIGFIEFNFFGFG